MLADFRISIMLLMETVHNSLAKQVAQNEMAFFKVPQSTAFYRFSEDLKL